jgi:O-antigen ligase
MIRLSRSVPFDHTSLVWLAEWFAVAVAIALPWSTTAVGICVAAWLIALLPTLDPAAVKRELASAAGGFPVLLWCLAALGMFWADVSWHERFSGFDSFHRLLAIPLLLAQFRRSNNGMWVVYGFFISSLTVLITSYFLVLVLRRTGRAVYGFPVHDTIFQGSLFLICGFGALGYAALVRGKQTRLWQLALLATGALFLLNFAFATASRIALAIAPLLLGWRLFQWKEF